MSYPSLATLHVISFAGHTACHIICWPHCMSYPSLATLHVISFPGHTACHILRWPHSMSCPSLDTLHFISCAGHTAHDILRWSLCMSSSLSLKKVGSARLREWYTPYQFEDPSPTIPTYIDRKKRKGKKVEDYSRDRAA